MREGYELDRFNMPDNFRPWSSRYDYPSEVIQDLDQRKPTVFTKRIIDLSVAQSAGNPLILAVPGRAFQLLGFVTASAIKASVDILVNVRINEISAEVFTGKHGRGFRGDFTKLILDWPAQANNSAELFTFWFDDVPFMVQDRF